MPSHNLAHIQIGDLDIIGYSVGGEETVVAVPQLDVCFDIGKAPDQVISINHVLLTHGHIDHAAGFAYYLSHRQFDGQVPGTIVAPQEPPGAHPADPGRLGHCSTATRSPRTSSA